MYVFVCARHPTIVIFTERASPLFFALSSPLFFSRSLTSHSPYFTFCAINNIAEVAALIAKVEGKEK